VQVTEEWLSNIFSQVLLSRARLIWFLYGFIVENPMDDLWVPPFMETSICFYVFESKLIQGLLISIGFACRSQLFQRWRTPGKVIEVLYVWKLEHRESW